MSAKPITDAEIDIIVAANPLGDCECAACRFIERIKADAALIYKLREVERAARMIPYLLCLYGGGGACSSDRCVACAVNKSLAAVSALGMVTE